MKKIMFNDKFHLTEAVLDGNKIQTRRNVNLTIHCGSLRGEMQEKYPDKIYYKNNKWMFMIDGREFNLPSDAYPQYNIGEEVAISQSYYSIYGDNAEEELINAKGFKNKMFVRSELMPHKILITGIKAERIQDISEEDCIKEGVLTKDNNYFIKCNDKSVIFAKQKDAFKYLIEKLNGKSFWENNRYVWRYDFKLIK